MVTLTVHVCKSLWLDRVYHKKFTFSLTLSTCIIPEDGHTPASNLGYLAPPPGQFFMGAKLFIGTPWMGNEGVLKKILVWAM